ncbi:MAG: cysteine--tRNA ligase [Deltaproteobacteria bacterium]|nr:cysteine--tRNA ligase [Deltaproteobacteria bacterium]
MSLRIYNTLSRKKETFEPLKSGVVGIYVCGPTVYDSCHIGHARSVVVFDVIVRYFKAKGFDVTYVRNFTDIDDKIINRAQELGTDPKALADKYINEFYEDMDALNAERATIEPRATDHIKQIIASIEKLVDNNFAYQINGDVYYSVESFKDYGKLSGRKLEDMEAGARIDIDERKKSPFDFSLWKSAKQGEPSWESPWGQGRPGWHIECSAMSTKYLGITFDIHGGGKDLIFPHHENEIAQSEALSGDPLTKYWIHHGFVNINHEKMSKSLNNILLVKDVLKKYHTDVIRYFLLTSHYRSPIDYTEKALVEARSSIDRFYKLLERISKSEIQLPSGENNNISLNNSEEYWNRFCEAMDDDFNTAVAIATLHDAVRDVNRSLDKTSKTFKDNEKYEIEFVLSQIYKMRDVLGVLLESPENYFESIKTHKTSLENLNAKEIEELIKERSAARQARDWGKADKIRKKLEEMKVVLEDSKEETIWRIEN